MKEFNLELAKQGKKVVTRDGREVTFGAYNQNALFDRQIVGWVGNNSYWWNGNGLFLAVGKEDELDLFMATEKKTVWIGLFKPHNADALNPLFTSHGMNTRREAELYYSTCATLIEVIEREIEV